MDCGDIWAPYSLSIFTCASSAVISIIAISSNLIVIAAFIKDPLKKLHTPFNYFLINISVSDLVTGFVVMPISVTTHYLESQRTIDSNARLAIRLSYLIASIASTLSVVALSIDRCFAIQWAIKYRQYLNYERCIIVSVCLWLLAFALPFLYFLVGYRNYLMIHANLSLVVGIGFLFGIYVRVYLFLRGHTQELRRNLRLSSTADKEFHLKRLLMEKKVTRAFLVILTFYVLTYLPAVVLIYIIFFCKQCSCTLLHCTRDIQFLLVASNSCVNAFICTLRLKDFRQAIRIIFTKRGRAISVANQYSCKQQTADN